MLKTNSAFVDVLVASVIERLQQGRPVTLPGIGTFRVEHQPARNRDGVGVQPRDEVVFKSEAQ